jgi:hypothetical protein
VHAFDKPGPKLLNGMEKEEEEKKNLHEEMEEMLGGSA